MWAKEGIKENGFSFTSIIGSRLEESLEDEALRRGISIEYLDTFRRSLESPEELWAEVGEVLDWDRPWNKVLDNTDQPFTKWYDGGELNACNNAVDRHIRAGKGGKVALIHDSPVTNTVTKVTYAELYEEVSKLAGVMASLGVKKGDRVIIYMPLIPQAIFAMLATVRLGAIHSVVFGGFAARELAVRIDHAEPKVVMTASCGVEPNKVVRYKDILNEALRLAKEKPLKCIVYQRRNVEECPLVEGMDVDWEDAVARAQPHPCVPVEANHPLYILYTSGTTGEPKGILRSTGGHLAVLTWTMKMVYGISGDDVWWTASDMGWVVGHSYICYGPLCAGVTSIMYEGKPDRTPHPGQYFRVIQEHKVNAIFTAPTALRVIRRVDPLLTIGKNYSTHSLRYVFVAGEHCDHETKSWAERMFKVPILNHWWQTETGHAITATCVGMSHSVKPPNYSTGLPLPGYDVHIVRSDGSDCEPGELGRIVIKLPLPPGVMMTLYKATKRFLDTYYSTYPGFYDTMDAGYRDEFGYIYVTARDDDVINVAGHRLATGALEDVVYSHPDVVEAAVFGVPEATKGDIPICLYVAKPGTKKNEAEINEELVTLVRNLIGPIAAMKTCIPVTALPRTRSGKTARKSLADLARNKMVKIGATIENPSVYKEIKAALQKAGYATTAPDPM